MPGLIEVIAGRIIANGVSAGLKKVFESNGVSAANDQLIEDTTIEVFYKGNYLDCIASGCNANQVAEVKIESRSSKTLGIEIIGYAAPIKGGLLGPFSTHYLGIEQFLVNDSGNTITLKPNGSIKFDLAPLIKRMANQKVSEAETSSLLFDLPAAYILGRNSKGGNVVVDPIAYAPHLPIISEFEGIGITFTILITLGDVLINKFLFGGCALKDPVCKLSSIDKNQNSPFMYLDGFHPAGYSFLSLNGNQKEGCWVQDNIPYVDDCVGEIGRECRGRVLRVRAVSDERLCPLFSNVFVVTNSPEYCEFNLEI